MPRMARVKTTESIFHIISKSISEIILFRDASDKQKYLFLIKKYKTLYNFKIYGYCLMDNHAHLIIDANGSDISKVMHGINFSYAMYFNKKYERDGHLFKDRFTSKIVDSEKYLKTLSLYMHNNPRSIVEYRTCPDEYAFSSLGLFLGKRHNHLNLVDFEYIMKLFGNNLKTARSNYYDLIYPYSTENLEQGNLEQDIEFEDGKTEYRSERRLLVRNIKPEDIVEFIAQEMNISKFHIHMKFCRNLVNAKALVVVLMRSLCNFKSSDITSALGNITQARVSKLSTIGINLIGTDTKYENIIQDFLKCYV
ncbi:MAG: transposase [Clostridium sp.]|uniref:transposase n=1 Tax=Clostridium sp. TaxID=1506 RepID=UPI003D6D8F52